MSLAYVILGLLQQQERTGYDLKTECFDLPTGKYLFQWLGTSAIGASGFFGITGLGKQFFMTDRNAYRQWLESWDILSKLKSHRSNS